MLTCDLCMKKIRSGHMTDYGMACPDCIDSAGVKQEKLYAELADEHPISMPPFLEVQDFERLALKLAIQSIKKMPEKERLRLAKTSPIMLDPRNFSLHLKEIVLEKMPRFYVSEMDHQGHERFFSAGTYVFKCKVPDTVILKAMESAGLIEGGPGEH